MFKIIKKFPLITCFLLFVFILTTADESIIEDPDDCILLNHQCTEGDICCENETSNLGPDAFSHVECNYRAEHGEFRCQEIIHYDQYIPEDDQ